jgi:cytoskeletal protein CcmA (bactofilin family)
VAVPLFAALLLTAVATPAFAAEVRQGDSVVVGANETINDDLYAFGSTVTILGTVNGDVFIAGSNITMSGTVTGDVFAAGGTTTISGDVRQSVRAVGGTIMLSGPVGKDALIAGGTTSVGGSARIGRDLLATTGTAAISGPVTRNVLVSGGEINLAGPVGGDVKAETETLRLSNGAQIVGGLRYTSPRQAEIAAGATVGGPTQRFEPQLRQQPVGPFSGPGVAVIDWIRGLVGLAVLGVIIAFVFPRFAQREVAVSQRSPWASLGLGFALLVGVPIVALVVLILGALIGGWWLSFFVLAAYALALVVGYVMSALFVGHSAVALLRFPEQHYAWYAIEGLALVGVLTLVPFVGGFIGLLAIVFGLGAFSLAIVEAYRGLPLVSKQATRAQPADSVLIPSPSAAS